MAENKRSFLLYTDVHFTVKKLTDEQSGKLFKHILAYVNDENPIINDLILEIAFEPIKQSLKRDLKRYEAICLRNKENGSKGGRPKHKPKKPSGLNGNPKNPDEPDNDNDSDSDNGIDIDSIIEIYNNTSFSKVEKITKMRMSHLKARIKEYSVQTVIDVIQRADRSDFLKGKNDRNWKANFDFIVKPEKFVKILEGFYDNKKERLVMP